MSDELFGKYEILGRLNTGGMGEILLARQKGVAGSERTVIIKMMLPHLISDPEFVDRFTDESRIAASLAHGNIVQVFESGCWEGRFYMVMEFVDGPDLKDVLTRVGRDVDLNRWLPFTVHVLSETAKALTYAYNRRDENDRPMRVVHRDVSPSNILVSRQGLVKLTDFGVAKATGRTSVTMPGKLHGKVCYMAPEQVRGMECDHRSDVFSLGVIGYEMLSGRRPFDADSDVGVLEKIRSMTFVDLAEAAPAVPAELCAIVSKAMAADPDSRWQTSEEFSAALLGWAHASGISLMSAGIESIISEYFGRQSGCAVNGPSIDDLMANAVDGLLRTPTSPPSRTGTVSRPIESTPTPAPAPARRTTGRRWPIFAGLAVIIALLLGWFLMSDRSDGPEPVVNPPPAALPDGFVAADASAFRAAPDAAVAESDESTVSDEGLEADRQAPEADDSTVTTTPGKVRNVAPAVQTQRPLHRVDNNEASQSADSRGSGRLIFRFFPADSTVLLDGRVLPVQGNLVEVDLPAGGHTLIVRSNKDDSSETRSFNIEAGSQLALGTIELQEPVVR